MGKMEYLSTLVNGVHMLPIAYHEMDQYILLV